MKLIKTGKDLKSLRDKYQVDRQTIADLMFVTLRTVYNWEKSNDLVDLLSQKRMSALVEYFNQYEEV